MSKKIKLEAIKALADEERYEDILEILNQNGGREDLSAFSPSEILAFAKAYSKIGDQESGISLLSDAEKVYPKNHKILQALAIRLQNNSKFDQAEIVWSKYAENNKSNLSLAYFEKIIEIHIRKMEYNEANKILKAAEDSNFNEIEFDVLKKKLLVSRLAGKSRVSREKYTGSSAQKALLYFIRFGFLPSKGFAIERSKYFKSVLDDNSIDTFGPGEFEKAKQILKSIMMNEVEKSGSYYVKIGVSSGYDSRGLLGALLDSIDESRIVAFTTGNTGNPDFDLARVFTEGLLSKHYLLTSDDAEYSLNWRPFKHRAMGNPMQLGAKNNVAALPSKYSDAVIPHGYLGDALSGKRLPKNLSRDWSSAVSSFCVRNTPFIREGGLYDLIVPTVAQLDDFVPESPFFSEELMSYDDQMNILYRQDQRVRYSAGKYLSSEINSVLASGNSSLAAILDNKSRKIICPYMDPRWVRSMLRLPIEERRGGKFYRDFLNTSYPYIFRETSDKNILQKIQSYKDSEKNYRLFSHSDWKGLFESNASFREFSQLQLRDLSLRSGLWFNPLDVLELAHEDYPAYELLLWGLISLEMNIKCGLLPEPSAVNFKDWRDVN